MRREDKQGKKQEKREDERMRRREGQRKGERGEEEYPSADEDTMKRTWPSVRRVKGALSF